MLTTNINALNVLNTPALGKPVRTVFAHTKNADAYWQALLYAASGQKDAALTLSGALQSGADVAVCLPWKTGDMPTIDALFDKLFIDFVSRDPQKLTDFGLFESIGIREHNAQLDDVSVVSLEQRLAEHKENLRILKSYSMQDLSADQKLSYEIFSWQLHHDVAGEKFLLHEYKNNQMYGTIQRLAEVLTQMHKLEFAQDVEHYIMRLSAVPNQFQQALELLKMQEAAGIVLPRCAIEKVLGMIKRLMPMPVENHLFYTHLKASLDALDFENKDALLDRAQEVIARDVYPAFQTLETYFMQLLDRVSDNNGVWALPDGDAYYAYMLQHHTSTDLSANEIYALGLQEVARITEEVRQIFVDEGMNDPEKTIGALIQEISKDPRFYYANTDEGRAECLADYERILERSRKSLAHLFGIKPCVGVKIQRVPAHEEGGAPAAYYCSPSLDGSRFGVFFANLGDMTEVAKYSMETLTIHEAEPGHHFQIALQSAMSMPVLRKLGECTAYCEGWALYAEKLAYEHGFYSSSFSRLGHLKDELWRAVRLLVDTGLHHKRWTREQAIACMVETTGSHYNDVVTEINRYLVMPGQACSYKIGQLKILELRQRAKDALGATFDIREFHDVVLGVGAVPLVVLEKVINNYIQRKLAS